MSIIRFNHFFIGLMAASGLCAFVLPPAVSGKFKGRADGLFAPVAYPIRKIAGAVSRQFNRSAAPAFDIASAPIEARLEIERLRTQVSSLTIQNDVLKDLAKERSVLGDALKYAVPVKVIGNDSGGRDALILNGSTRDGIRDGQAVLRHDALIGRVVNASGGGAQVRLITDRNFAVSAAFGRFRQTKDGRSVEFVPIATPSTVVEGRGNGTMSVRNLTLAQVKEAGIVAGDYVALRDREDWPLVVNGFLIGQVEAVKPNSPSPGFAEVTVRPRQNLMQLSGEVMVINTSQAAPTTAKPIDATPVSNKRK